MNIGISKLHERSPVAENARSGGKAPAPNSPQSDQARAHQGTSSSVSLHGSMRLQQKMAADTNGIAPLDVANVERLRAAIQSGDYRVDLRSLANNLVTQETEVFGR